ncbi:MAG: CorA family divalent cation transporter [Roseburia sp.]
MQQVLSKDQIDCYEMFLNKNVIAYIKENQTTAFEGFADYNLLAFDWYDVEQKGVWAAPIMIYIDKDNLFFLCEHERTKQKVEELFSEISKRNEEKTLENEQVLYLFFAGLLRNDMDLLAAMEDEITEAEDETLLASRKEYLKNIVMYRKELLRLKRYYEQVDAVLDHLTANANGLLSEESVRRFVILANRTERFRNSVLNLRDYVTQMREAYQAQIDIEQNNLMKVFTVITAVFLPLTLMVGWYGMNFETMPEFSWKYGYIAFIGVSVLVCVGMLIFFKKKKWF